MSVLGFVLIWGWFAVAMVVLSRWPMGKLSALRQEFWTKYEK